MEQTLQPLQCVRCLQKSNIFVYLLGLRCYIEDPETQALFREYFQKRMIIYALPVFGFPLLTIPKSFPGSIDLDTSLRFSLIAIMASRALSYVLILGGDGGNGAAVSGAAGTCCARRVSVKNSSMISFVLSGNVSHTASSG